MEGLKVFQKNQVRVLIFRFLFTWTPLRLLKNDIRNGVESKDFLVDYERFQL